MRPANPRPKSETAYSENAYSENALITILAAVQFTHVLDFVIMMPLGPTFMRIFAINAQQFSFLVSAYTISAGASGIIGSFFLDRFDRKKALLVAYGGFIVGTLACAVSPTYEFLLMARSLAGVFGGFVGTLVFSILGDMIPMERRGLATGRVSASFAISSVIGVPAGIYLGQLGSWHTPFVAIGALGVVIIVFAFSMLPVMVKHLQHKRTESQLRTILNVLSEPNHLYALSFQCALMTAGFSVIPFVSPYLVKNVGFTEAQLPLVYFISGLFTFFTSQYIGKLSDRFGKHRMFYVTALASVVPILILTNLPAIPVPLALVCTTLFVITVSGRFVPGMALITSATNMKVRGTFMSINSSVQNMSSGLAAYIAGLMMTTASTGELVGYNHVGYLAVACTFGAMVIARKVETRS